MMMADSSINIKQLKRKLSQTNERIIAQRMLERKRETKEKSSLGKVFLLSGFDSICDEAHFTYRHVIIIGALAKKAGLHVVKMSHFLGACAIMIERAKDDEGFLQKCVCIGENAYDGAQKLERPFDLIMGILMKAAEYLADESHQPIAHQRGDALFNAFKEQRTQERLEQSINNAQVYYV